MENSKPTNELNPPAHKRPKGYLEIKWAVVVVVCTIIICVWVCRAIFTDQSPAETVTVVQPPETDCGNTLVNDEQKALILDETQATQLSGAYIENARNLYSSRAGGDPPPPSTVISDGHRISKCALEAIIKSLPKADEFVYFKFGKAPEDADPNHEMAQVRSNPEMRLDKNYVIFFGGTENSVVAAGGPYLIYRSAAFCPPRCPPDGGGDTSSTAP